MHITFQTLQIIFFVFFAGTFFPENTYTRNYVSWVVTLAFLRLAKYASHICGGTQGKQEIYLRKVGHLQREEKFFDEEVVSWKTVPMGRTDTCPPEASCDIKCSIFCVLFRFEYWSFFEGVFCGFPSFLRSAFRFCLCTKEFCCRFRC